LVPDWRVHRLYSVHSAGSGTEVQRCTRSHYSYRLPSLPFGLYMQQSEFDTTCAVAVARAVQNLLMYLGKLEAKRPNAAALEIRKTRAGKVRRTRRNCMSVSRATPALSQVPSRRLILQSRDLNREEPRGDLPAGKPWEVHQINGLRWLFRLQIISLKKSRSPPLELRAVSQ
jgi:hypothetical protein